MSDVDNTGKGLKRKAGVYPPAVRNMLKSIGNETITSLKVVRTPLSKYLRFLLNVLTLNAFERALRESPYDSMFHLALFINDKYTTDKQSVVNLTKSNPVQKNSETKDVPVENKQVTIQELLDNGRKQMGDEKFSNYDARTNNCQSYVIGLLQGSGFLTNDVQQFIKQDAEVIFKKLPTLSQKLMSFTTELGAVADRITEGEGKKKTPCWEGYEMIGTKTKKGRKVPNCVPLKEEWIEIGTGMYHFPVHETMMLKIEQPLIGGSYKLYKQSDECYTLTNIDTGKVHGYCMTEDEAKKKMDLLCRVRDEEVTKKIVKEDLSKKNIVHKKTKPMKSWREFWSDACKGKKFSGGRKEINEFMKQKAKEYREMKAKSK